MSSNKKIDKIKSNKRELLKEVGVKSIIAYRKINPNFTSDDEAYRHIQQEHNNKIDREIRRNELINNQTLRHQKIVKKVNEAFRKLDEDENAKPKINVAKYITNNEDSLVLFNALNNRNARTVILTNEGRGYTTASKTLFTRVTVNTDFANESDAEMYQVIGETSEITLSNVLKSEGSNQQRSGNFFKHILKPECYELMKVIDFKEFQIYDKIQDEAINCFLYSLKMSGKVTDDMMTKLKVFVKNKTVRKRDIPFICDVIKCNIHLNILEENRKRTIKYKPSSVNVEDDIIINLYDEHYFIEKEVNITSYALEHYEELKDLKGFNNIFNEQKQKKKDRYISSWELVKYLVDNADRFLKPISLNNTDLWNTNMIENFVDTIEITNLKYDEECLKEPENIALNWDDEKMSEAIQGGINDKNNSLKLGLTRTLEELSVGVKKYEKGDIVKERQKRSLTSENGKINNYVDLNIFSDFETTTDGETHKEYMMCSLLIDEEGKKRKFQGVGDDCCNKVLNDIRKYIVGKKYDLKNTTVNLIFHNAKYDVNFIINKCEKIQYLENGSQFVCAEMNYKGMRIKVKDSYKLLPFKLCDFAENFKLSVKKELLPYEQYTSVNVKKSSLNLYYETLLTGYKNNDVYDYVNNMIIWGCIENNDIDVLDTLTYHFVDEKYNDKVNYLEILKTLNSIQFNHIKYSLKYCELDCEVLQQGYAVFRKWILEMPDMLTPDINDVLTLPSLAFKIFEMNGCYDDVYQIGGVLQHFINKTIVGGRVMCANNEKQKVGFETHGDYLADFDAVSLYPSGYSRLQGFLKGVAKVLREYQLNYDTIKNFDGYFIEIVVKSVGRFRTMPLGSFKDKITGTRNFTNDLIGKTLFVDKTTLEDLVEFQNITFDIVRGYYYDEGFNDKAVYLMRKIFNERVKLKKIKNPAEQAYKLLMNSAYGKNIRKQAFSSTVMCDNEGEFNKYLNRNYNFIKRFWKFGDKYRVETLKGLEFHYNYAHIGSCILSMSKRIMNEVVCCGDDAVSVFYQDTDSLHILRNDVDKLRKAYNDKYGRELIGKGLGQFHTDFSLNYKGKSYSDNVYSRNFIGLGKKCYIDELVLLDNEGEPMKDEEGVEIVDYHIRMKGVSNKAIIRRCEEINVTPKNLYTRLYEGETIDFDLLLGNDNKTSFAFGKNMTVSSRRNEMNEEGKVIKYKFMRSVSFQ